MKIWLVLCVALSGALVALQFTSIDSCGLSFKVIAVHNDEFRFSDFHMSLDCEGNHSIQATNPLFRQIGADMQPGEQVTVKRRYSKLPVLRTLSYDVASRSRDGRQIAAYKLGELRFFAALAGVAALPLVIFGISFALLRLNPERRQATP